MPKRKPGYQGDTSFLVIDRELIRCRWHAELLDLRELRQRYRYRSQDRVRLSDLERRITAVEWILRLYEADRS